MLVTVELRSNDPTRDTPTGFDVHPPLTSTILDDIDIASALAKAGCETAEAMFRYRFVPHIEPQSVRPEDVAPARFDPISKDHVSDREQRRVHIIVDILDYSSVRL